MLGVYEPMIWRAKPCRTFRQVLTFISKLFCPLFKKLPQFLPSVFFLGKGIDRKYTFESTIFSGKLPLASAAIGPRFHSLMKLFPATDSRPIPRFYLSAENKRSCHALWCSVPGACSRRVSFLRGVSPNLLDAGAQLSGVPKGGVAVLRDADIARSAEDYPKKEDEGGRNARRGKASLEAVAATDVVAADQAAALSAALTEEDQAVRTGGGGRKPLFTSCHALGVQGKEGSGIEGAEGGGGGGGEPANIVVVSRCRPLLLREIKRGVRAAVFCNGDEIVVSDRALPNNRSRRFGFDRVFGEIIQVVREISPMRLFAVLKRPAMSAVVPCGRRV